MSQAFDAALGALWSALGLPTQRLDAEGRAALTVDGRTITLAQSADERGIVVSTILGVLAAEPHEAASQMRRLMHDSAGLILLKRAALRLEPGMGKDGREVLEVQASAPCDARRAATLISAIEDVLFVAEAHAGTLKAESPGRTARAPVLDVADMEGSLIFRL